MQLKSAGIALLLVLLNFHFFTSSREFFPNPEGDISLSPNGNWFVNGHKVEREGGNKNFCAVYRRSDGAFVRRNGMDIGAFSGDIRIDPAPRWNRSNDKNLVPGIDNNKTGKCS